MSVDAYFSGHDKSRRLYDRVMELTKPLEGTKVTVTRSQISLRRKRSYAWLWMPGRYLKGGPAPLVLTVALPRRDDSARWKEVVEPKPGNYIHHVELWKLGDVDKDVRAWLRRAWEEAS
jgi:hypothetical protein